MSSLHSGFLRRSRGAFLGTAELRKGSGESLRKTRIFPREKNPLPVLAALSSREAERNRARSAAEGFLMDSPSPSFT